MCLLGKFVLSCKHAKFMYYYMNENTNESVIKRTHFYLFCICGQLRLGSGFFCSLLFFIVYWIRILYIEKRKKMSIELCLLFYTHPYTHIMRDVDCVCVFKIVNVVEVCRIYCKHWSLHTLFVRFKLDLDLPVFALFVITITTVYIKRTCVCLFVLV